MQKQKEPSVAQASPQYPQFAVLTWEKLRENISENRLAIDRGENPSMPERSLGEKLRWFFSKTRLMRYFVLKPICLSLHIVLMVVFRRRLIRIGTLNKKGLITIMIMYIEPYMRRLELEGHEHPLLIVINPGLDPNEALTKMYARKVLLLDDERPVLRAIFSFLLHRLIIPAESRLYAFLSGGEGKHEPYYSKGSPVLDLSDAEKEEGEKLLASMGIESSDNIVCFGVRESSYYRGLRAPGRKERFYNFEHNDEFMVRNPPISNYFKTAEALAKRGHYVLRMGSVVDSKLPDSLHPSVIDYASDYRTPFGDVYLHAKCKFALVGAAGLWLIALAFNRPVILTDNYGLFSRLWRRGDLFLPTLFWYKTEKRFLSFSEMIAGQLYLAIKSNLERMDLELVFNAPEEILEVTEEMLGRLDGSWQEDEEVDRLHDRFEALYPPTAFGCKMKGRMGSKFLLRHKDLVK